MSNFDKTGPQGEGPQTGRGLGPCANNDGQFAGRGIGRGRGRGCGIGRGQSMGRGRRQGRNAQNQS